jgi:hypothetical protein
MVRMRHGKDFHWLVCAALFRKWKLFGRLIAEILNARLANHFFFFRLAIAGRCTGSVSAHITLPLPFSSTFFDTFISR